MDPKTPDHAGGQSWPLRVSLRRPSRRQRDRGMSGAGWGRGQDGSLAPRGHQMATEGCSEGGELSGSEGEEGTCRPRNLHPEKTPKNEHKNNNVQKTKAK